MFIHEDAREAHAAFPDRPGSGFYFAWKGEYENG
jgi:hypothetical protein